VPIITFLQDIFAATKGRYYRTVGRHTQKFCSKAVKMSVNDVQKRIFFVTAICADELVAALMRVDKKRQVGPFNGRTLKQKLPKQQIAAALRVYMSGILTLTSVHKEALLAVAGMQEEELLHTWCKVFDYSPSDMDLFDTVFLPAYRQGGIITLSTLVGKSILEQLFATDEAMSSVETELLQTIMLEDASAVIQIIQNCSQGGVKTS
jgi:nucleotidyltransferase/DNA polymerase involved in DNA repair